MKTPKILVLILLMILYSCSVQRPGTRNYGNYRNYNDISAQIFYDELSPYGHWVHNRQYDFVWIPNVGRNFHPYATNGRWIMTEYGWTWLSDYRWGWAPFHYGRWDYDPYYGWIWFPGYEWAPAWVEWRAGDGYYGWAPLKPGMDFGRNLYGRNFDPELWIFIRGKDFGRSDIARHLLRGSSNREIIRSTRIISNTYTDNQREVIYNAGPDPNDIRQATGRRFSRFSVRESNTPGQRIRNNQLEIYRPRIERSSAMRERPSPRRITDIDDIRPVRQRSRTIEQTPSQSRPNEYNQGRRQSEIEKLDDEETNRRQREIRRQNMEKMDARQQRQMEIEEEQQQRQSVRQRSQDVRKEQLQKRNERIQNTDQQKKQMQKERERTTRQSEVKDTSVTRKVMREQNRNVRRK
jgi:hypothetical protein